MLHRVANFFLNFLPGFLKIFHVFKITLFRVYFKFKSKFKITVPSSITTLKRYCKATLNLYFNKKNSDVAKHFLCMVDFSSQIKILLLKM